MATKKELLAEAEELGLAFIEGTTNAEIQAAIDNQKAQEAPEVSGEETAVEPAPVEGVTPASNPGSDIASAITQGLKDAKGDKTIKIAADNSITPRYTVVRNKQGEVMIRENETGVLSKVQLESIEEKEASIQGQEVEEV